MNKVIKFVQPSCAPCKMVDGLLKHLGFKVDETMDIAMDEKAFELAQAFGVKSTPTLVLVDENNNLIDSVSGLNQEGINKLFAQRG